MRQSCGPFGPTNRSARVIGSTDPTGKQSRGPAVWVGDIDELWKFPRPTGRGGPWHDSAVEAGRSSDSYLMGGYDRNRMELSHDCLQPVQVTIEIDPTGDARWFAFATFEASAGKPLSHDFPEGFSWQWVRLRIDRDCRATTVFTYR